MNSDSTFNAASKRFKRNILIRSRLTVFGAPRGDSPCVLTFPRKILEIRSHRDFCGNRYTFSADLFVAQPFCRSRSTSPTTYGAQADDTRAGNLLLPGLFLDSFPHLFALIHVPFGLEGRLYHRIRIGKIPY
jgi:hypothetical protein